MSDSTLLTRVELYNYKSIAHCDVELRPLMFLVGPNGAGKSNFLDALHFIADALNTSLDQAVRQRGGIQELKRRGSGLAQSLIVRLYFSLPTGETGTYFIRILQAWEDNYYLLSEECRVRSPRFTNGEAYFYVDTGEVTTSEGLPLAASTDRLYLVAASSLPAFRPVYDALSRMAFYNLNPAAAREPQEPDAREELAPDGDNIASVLKRLGERLPRAKRRIEEFLAVIVPGVQSVAAKAVSSYQIVEFHQQFAEGEPAQIFPAAAMSDGTLRALGVLVALYQGWSEADSPIPLVGIEEPETALHPAAVSALLDAMREASLSKQVLVATHSADIMDDELFTPDMLLAVAAAEGVTQIGPIDRGSRSILRDHLFTAGQLQRMNQLEPDQSEPEEDEANATSAREKSAA